MSLTLPDFLEEHPDGEIRLRGHRIRLIDVAARYEEGHGAEAIAIEHYPDLSLALVHKTIAFYLEHEREVRKLVDQNAEVMRRLETQPRTTPTFAELRRRMDVNRQKEAL
jgi:uncharacterized protein (DUF433 family)